MQKYTLDHVTETTTSVISLPDNEMKGRIIGRDGRNIQAFEMSTGIDVIVDDTPNAVVLSGFNPMRREIAKLSMEKLIQDGRIHPGFIEQVVSKTQEEISDLIQDTGEQVLFDLGITGVRSELAMLLGQLKYRMTGGQNALHHSREVAELAGIMAQELDLDVTLARRCGLLHDIGKAVEGGPEGALGELGRSAAGKYGEPPEVLECIDAIHENLEEVSPMAVMVRTADALSMSRPGALREPLEKYVRRLREMERLVSSFEGVSRAFVMKAGKEVRVMIDHEEVDDLRAVQLATEIARKIQARMEYPGQVKVTVIRQTRAVEIAPVAMWPAQDREGRPGLVNEGDNGVLTVTELTAGIKTLLEEAFPYVTVSGEISNYKRHASGHAYFSLKDEPQPAALRHVAIGEPQS